MTRKQLLALTVTGCMILTAAFCVTSAVLRARAESMTVQAWILCKPAMNGKPADYIHVRETPSRKADSIGRLECGDPIRVTGKTKDGWAEVEISLEESTGWVFAPYIVFEEPEHYGGREFSILTNGRVACRKYPGGDRVGWVTDGTKVKVYAVADGWSITNRGFIMSEYIDFGR